MADLSGEVLWNIQLTNNELLLVLKCLGGRLRDYEVDEALELDKKLSGLRAARLRALVATADQIDKAIKDA